MFCKHEWEIIVDKLEKSPMERLTDKGSVKLGEYSTEMMLGTRIIILQCTKCGKLDKTTERV